MGRRQQHTLESRLEVLMMHLLKWRYQPTWQTPSWRRTIREQRRQLVRLVRRRPSLRPRIPPLVTENYPRARTKALDETGLPDATLPRPARGRQRRSSMWSFGRNPNACCLPWGICVFCHSLTTRCLSNSAVLLRIEIPTGIVRRPLASARGYPWPTARAAHPAPCGYPAAGHAPPDGGGEGAQRFHGAQVSGRAA